MRRMILSENVSDEKIFLFFSLLGNSIPYLVRLSGHRRTTTDEASLSYESFRGNQGTARLFLLKPLQSHAS